MQFGERNALTARKKVHTKTQLSSKGFNKKLLRILSLLLGSNLSLLLLLVLLLLALTNKASVGTSAAHCDVHLGGLLSLK
jgi:hypothetical protein